MTSLRADEMSFARNAFVAAAHELRATLAESTAAIPVDNDWAGRCLGWTGIQLAKTTNERRRKLVILVTPHHIDCVTLQRDRYDEQSPSGQKRIVAVIR